MIYRALLQPTTPFRDDSQLWRGFSRDHGEAGNFPKSLIIGNFLWVWRASGAGKGVSRNIAPKAEMERR
jgi:hypothetical protein